LLVEWENYSEEGTVSSGHAVYTAGWVSPTGDCHTQQNFHFVAQKGEVRADQAHRGYSLSADKGTDAATVGGTGALATLNPLYMRYVPDQRGCFAGQQGYGYRSMEAFVTSLKEIDSGDSTVAEIESSGILATAANTIPTTAILEAGRRSLNEGGRPIRIIYGLNGIATNFE